MKVWDPKSGSAVVTLQGFGFHEAAVTSLTLHPNHGNIIGSTGADGTAVVSNITSGKVLNSKRDHADSVESLAFCTRLGIFQEIVEKKLFFLSFQAISLILLSAKSMKSLGRIKRTTSYHFCSMPFLATGSLDKQIIIYDVNTMQVRLKCQHEVIMHLLVMSKDGVTKVLWHPSQPLLYSSSLDKTVRVWDARTGQAVKVFRGHSGGVLDMAMSR